MFLNLQPGIRKGNPRSIEAGVKVLRHAAQINGYAAPQRHELTGKDGTPLTLVQLLEAVGPCQRKKMSKEELSAEQKAFVRKVVRDPVRFAAHILGVDLWQREAEILRSIKNHRRTAVKACHGVGKTFTLAVGALWWLARYPEGIALTTSPTQRQVRSRLSLVQVDAIGVGHHFGLHLRDCRFPVELVNVGMPCQSKPEWGENDPAR
jgi:hypothetical protein